MSGPTLLGLDDTDSVRGGCTTHTAYELVRRLRHVDLIGPPRLVRLNPNIPFKTRGNGAVALRLGHGRGRQMVVGRHGDDPLVAYEAGDEPDAVTQEEVFLEARRLIDRTARLDDPKTNPGLVQAARGPDATLYRSAVQRLVGVRDALACLAETGARFAGWKNGRGLLGAAAALSWPAREGTYEWVAYRPPERWGTPRDVDPRLGPELDRLYPTTFDNWDALHRHLRIAPASPCPVLAGIRGTDASDLERAQRRIGPEAATGGLLFATNQATDEHIAEGAAATARPFEGLRVAARVTRRALTVPGGHVFLRVEDGTGELDLAAFEPTKEFRHVVRGLRPGDAVRAQGGLHADPTLLSLEKLEVLDAVPRRRVRAPRCGACDRSMKSRGRGEAYRCGRCRLRSPALPGPDEAAPSTGAYEVPVAVRRHLARPLALRALARLGA